MHAFKQNIINIYRDKGIKWLENLPGIAWDLAKRWSLSNLVPLSNLSFNYILSGLQHGQPIILKIGLDNKALARETLALKNFSNYGSVRVLNEIPGALLLEKVEPGISLKNYSSISNKEKLEICCDMMERLHMAPFCQENFPSIDEWLIPINRNWDLPIGYLEKARHIINTLHQYNMSKVLLHGDLHDDNILLGKNSWMIIDPKGVVGYPINEVWAFINNIETDAQYIADRFNWGTQFVIEWYFVHLILAVCWNLEDNLDPRKFLSLAEKTYQLI